MHEGKVTHYGLDIVLCWTSIGCIMEPSIGEACIMYSEGYHYALTHGLKESIPDIDWLHGCIK